MSPLHLKLLRQLILGMSLREVGLKMGYSNASIKRYEDGTQPLPPGYIAKFQRVFNLSDEHVDYIRKMADMLSQIKREKDAS